MRKSSVSALKHWSKFTTWVEPLSSHKQHFVECKMLCCQNFVITFHSIKQSVSSVIKIMYMKCQLLRCVKNPKSFIFSVHYSKRVPTFLFKIYICSLWKPAKTNNEIWLSTGAGILFIILSRPGLGPSTLVPNGLFPETQSSWQLIPL